MSSLSAWTTPSRVAPSSNPSTIARPWCMATMFSLRVSVQRTGLPVWRAVQPTSTSSTSRPLAPNPPPTSGATTRTCSASNPSSIPSTILSWCGVWDEIHRVSRPSSPNWALDDRGSIGRPFRRWLINCPVTTTSLEANSSGSGSSGRRKQMLVPTSG